MLENLSGLSGSPGPGPGTGRGTHWDSLDGKTGCQHRAVGLGYQNQHGGQYRVIPFYASDLLLETPHNYKFE